MLYIIILYIKLNMKENIILILKGIIIGMGKIIPGVSGGILAISLGVYEKCLSAVSHPIREIKKNFKFLFLLTLGIFLSIFIMSNLIKISLTNYYLPTMLFFIGLIAGGIPSLFDEVKYSFSNIILMLISMLFLIFMFNINGQINHNNGFLFYLLMGVLEAFSMIVPGVSGTSLLMLFGVYDEIITLFSQLDFLNNIFIYFIIGVIIGVIIFVKIMEMLFNKYSIKMRFVIIGFALSSTFILIIQTFSKGFLIKDILIGFILFIVGYFIGYKLEVINKI